VATVSSRGCSRGDSAGENRTGDAGNSCADDGGGRVIADGIGVVSGRWEDECWCAALPTSVAGGVTVGPVCIGTRMMVGGCSSVRSTVCVVGRGAESEMVGLFSTDGLAGCNDCKTGVCECGIVAEVEVVYCGLRTEVC
jgi:hypothetical protein